MEELPPFTPVFKKDGIWIVASCHEFPEANGQGKTKAEANQSLSRAVAMVAEDRMHDKFLSEYDPEIDSTE